jgi:hypothetical protein
VCDDVVGAHDEEHYTKPSEHGIGDDPIQQQHGDDNLQTGARIREHEGWQEEESWKERMEANLKRK